MIQKKAQVFFIMASYTSLAKDDYKGTEQDRSDACPVCAINCV